MQEKDTTFKFWVPAEIEKGKKDTKTGKEKWKFKGIASTADVDTDGEILQPEGFDLSYFLSDGFVNWNHQSKNNPSAIIGEPTMAQVVPEGLYVETELYQDSTVASSVWDLGKILDSSSSNRKLGFSIEGKVISRDPNDDKKITKAKITGLAITPSPKNKSTFADIVKGNIFEGEWEYDLLKADDILGDFVVDITDEDGNRVTVDKSLNINIIKAKNKHDFSDDERKKLSENGEAMSDGSYPIRNEQDLKDAIKSYGRAKDKDAVKTWIRKRAKELKKEDLLPDDWSKVEKDLSTVSASAIVPSNFSTANPHYKPDKENLKNISDVSLDNSKDSSNLKQKLTKSEVFEKIFTEITTDLEKAETIYSLIEKIELQNSENMIVKSISLDTISKAFAALNINFEKGEVNEAGMTNAKADTTPALATPTAEMNGDPNGGMTEDMVMGMMKGMEGDCKGKKEMMSKAIQKGVSENMAKKAYSKAVEKGIIKASEDDMDDEDDDAEKAKVKKAEDRVLKAEKEAKDAKEEFESLKKKGKKELKKKKDSGDVDDVEPTDDKNKVTKSENPELIKALAETGSLVKALVEQNQELSKSMIAQNESFNKKFEEFEKSSTGRRSVQTTQFLEKGLENEIIKKAEGEGKRVVRLSDPEDSRYFKNILEKATFADVEKGGTVNKFYGDTMCQMELGASNAKEWLGQKGVVEKIESDLKVKLIP